jgi:monovalent cation/proton antiporter MnhG/PhaG subunit
MLRLSDIAQVRRGHSDPPQPLFRVNGEPAIGLAIAMRDGGDIIALGKNLKRTMAEVTAELPLGINPKLVADQAVTVETAISEFTTSLLQAIAIILVTSFISLGVRPGLIIALAIPLTLLVVFPLMQLSSIDMQRISLGALIIALALLVDDAMTTTDAMVSRLAQGDDKVQAATFAFRTYAFAMLAGTLVTIAGFVPVGFAASSAGEYTFSLFAVVAITLIVSWFVAVIFAPLLGVAILRPPKATRACRGRRRIDPRAPRHLRFHCVRQEGDPPAGNGWSRISAGRMTLALNIVTITAVSAGAFFFLAGTVGLLRFPDTLTRLHALTKADNLGLGLVVLGLLPIAGSLREGLKLVCVWLLVLLAGATVSQLIARAARQEGPRA